METTTPDDPKRETVIGILCMDISSSLLDLDQDARYFIAASYVKYYQNAGAKVMPIRSDQDYGYYDDVMGKINGILIPGGAVYFPGECDTVSDRLTNHCVSAVAHIYKLAKERKSFPVMGTCLGMELLLYEAADRQLKREQFAKRIQESRCLQFTDGYKTSRLFANLTEQMGQRMTQTPFAHHFHKYYFTRQDLLTDDWHVLAESVEKDKRFITVIEHRSYPIYGTIFHPERVAYEKREAADEKDIAYDHTDEACETASYFAKFFVEQCRQNTNHFNVADAQNQLIENCQLTECPDKHWQKVYLFR